MMIYARSFKGNLEEMRDILEREIARLDKDDFKERSLGESLLEVVKKYIEMEELLDG